ncbi:MAG: hypothetical protein ILN61_03540 [Lachnospiraceae bacterium]|nr:hypothetical protein [Lachnospiraceae bacterium]
MKKGQNRNKAETYLRKIRDNDRALKSKRDELDALRYKASGAGAIRYDKDHVQTSPQDYLSLAMDDIIRIEKQIEEKEAILEELKGKAYTVVRQIPQTDHRIIIEWYYLNGLSMIATADKMSIAERTAYYLRDDALDSFGKVMGK